MRRHLAKFLSAYRAHRKLMPWYRALRWSLHVVRIDYRIARKRAAARNPASRAS